MANASGLIRINAVLLSVAAGTAVVTNPTSANIGGSVIGVNDSGLALGEARDYTKWTFTLIGGGTGYSILILGTNDPLAYAQWRSSFNPQAYFGRPGGNPVLPPTSWIQLDAPSSQAGTGAMGNPLTAATPLLQFSGALSAVRAVLIGSANPVGTVSVVAEAAP